MKEIAKYRKTTNLSVRATLDIRLNRTFNCSMTPLGNKFSSLDAPD